MVDKLNGREMEYSAGLKESLLKSASQYKNKAILSTTGAIGLGALLGTMVVNALKSGNIGTLIPQLIGSGGGLYPEVLLVNSATSNFKKSREFMLASQFLSNSESSKWGPEMAPDLHAVQEKLVEIATSNIEPERKLLDIAELHALRMPIINMHKKTGDLDILDAQAASFQEKYLRAKLTGGGFEVTDLKTVSEPSPDLDVLKKAWTVNKVKECEWAMAYASGDNAKADAWEWECRAGTFNDDVGLNLSLVDLVNDIKSKRK